MADARNIFLTYVSKAMTKESLDLFVWISLQTLISLNNSKNNAGAFYVNKYKNRDIKNF